MTNKTKSNLERFLKRFMLAHIIKGDQVRRYRYEHETETVEEGFEMLDGYYLYIFSPLNQGKK